LKPTPKIRKVDPFRPEPACIDEALAWLKKDGVIVFPTRGLYGIGADATSPAAAARVFAVKHREPHKPLLVLVKDRQSVLPLVKRIPEAALKLMDHFWPGQVTIVFDAHPSLPGVLTGGSGRIGIRLPQHPVAMALTVAFGRPITGTSANLSGQPGCANVAALAPEVAAAVDLILDAGPLQGGPGSTVVDVSGAEPVILREGVVSAERILAALSS
jgi:L-threonylcarbamoyladenylate synthase